MPMGCEIFSWLQQKALSRHWVASTLRFFHWMLYEAKKPWSFRLSYKHARVNGGIVVTRKLRMGSVVKEIAATAWEENIDLIVVELRKRFPFLNLTVLKLLQLSRKLPCPVLLEPAVAKDGRAAMGRLISLRPAPP